MDKLLPCPFCGSKAYMGKHRYAKGYWIVRCGSDGGNCPLFPSTGSILEKDVPKAIKAWNTRKAVSK